MQLRLGLYELMARYALSGQDRQQLLALAGLGAPPPDAARRLAQAVALLGAGLAGLGLVMWIASQWGGWSRPMRLGFVQAVLLLSLLAAARWPAGRAPLTLLGWLALGGLLALIGQTYQTGADPWQLFALWTALGLPLAWVARSDTLWAGWVIVAAVALALWRDVYPGDSAQAGLALALLTVWLLVSPPVSRWSGSGLWPRRVAAVASVLLLSAAGVVALFSHGAGLNSPGWWISVAALSVAAVALAWPRGRDIWDMAQLAAVALGLYVLAVLALGQLILDGPHTGDPIGQMLLLGVVSAAMLAGVAMGLMSLQRRQSQRLPHAQALLARPEGNTP